MKVNKRALINGTIVGIALVIFIGFAIKPKNNPQQMALSEGQVSIGGTFSMTDDNGVRRTPSDFAGQSMLIYFGYSFCPDVCPLDLQKISMALTSLENEAIDISSLQPIFITIDPERDTPAIMHEYLQNFHPAIIGLSGSLAELKVAAQAYRVYYSKGDIQIDGSYLMDHSSIIYLMGPDGQFIRHFSPDQTPLEIAKGLKNELSHD